MRGDMNADITWVGNLIDGILWVCVGVCFAISLVRPGWRHAKAIAAVNFLAFGASDFMEMHTGAWWRPLWLLAWKGACLLVMLVQFAWYLKCKSRAGANRYD